MAWDYWLMTRRDGMEEFTPVELGDDGAVENVVIGFGIISSLDSMKERAKKIWLVEDIFDLTIGVPEKVWDAAKERT